MIMDNYDEIRELLKPRREIKASSQLRASTETLLEKRCRKNYRLRWFWGIGTAVVAAAAMGVLLMPFGMSAKDILSSAIKVLSNEKTVEMTVEVRTRPVENFSYIDIDDDFVPHKIISTNFDSIPSWSVDKGGRVAVGLDGRIYCWLTNLKCGWTDYRKPEDALAGMAIFLSPKTILEAELSQCASDSGASYVVDEKDGEILLTVNAEPQGDFANPYMLDTSIRESRNVRRYVIDAATRLLKSASVSIISDGREIEVLRVSDIRYGGNVSVTPPPADIDFSGEDGIPGAFAGMSPEDAARKILGAFEKWDTSVINLVIDPDLAERAFKPDYNGAVLLEVGEAFQSGEYPGFFVPYSLRLPNGYVKNYNVALRHTNKGGWEIDGGL